MVPLRVLFGMMIGTGLMGLGIGYEMGQRSRPVEKEAPASTPVCSLGSGPILPNSSTSSPGVSTLRTIRVRNVKVECSETKLGPGVWSELTEEVVRAIVWKTPYKVVSSGDADTDLTYTIRDFRKQTPPGYPRDGSERRDIETHLLVRLTWKDLRTGRSLLPRKDGSSPASVELLSVACYRPEIGQSIDTARRDNIRASVNQILAQMEMSW